MKTIVCIITSKFSNKRFRRRIWKTALKIFAVLNLISFLFWVAVIDGVNHWLPYVIMIANLLFLGLVSIATQRKELKEEWEDFKRSH